MVIMRTLIGAIITGIGVDKGDRQYEPRLVSLKNETESIMKRIIWGLSLAVTLGCGGSGSSADNDTSSDAGGDSDGDADSGPDGDTDTDTDIGNLPMTDCAGGAYDPNSNLCWESDPILVGSRTWEEAKDRCENLVAGGQDDWRLPTISELRTFYRPGDAPECVGLGWSLDWEEAPEGFCGVHDGCLSNDNCYDMDLCYKPFAAGCKVGPGQHDDCFWDEFITGAVICGWYWSSSMSDNGEAWAFDFRNPWILTKGINGNGSANVRCVRAGTDTDTDTEPEPSASPMEPCAGGYVDPGTDLCWQDPPSDTEMDWSAAIDYCEALDAAGHTDWQLPDIDELVSLIRGCVEGVETGDLSRNTCGVDDPDCLDNACDSKADCNPCSEKEGPGPDGYYWDPALNSHDGRWYWSRSSNLTIPTQAWYVSFPLSYVVSHPKENMKHARCVRSR